jgi:hypothetical protein
MGGNQTVTNCHSLKMRVAASKKQLHYAEVRGVPKTNLRA